MIDVSKLECTCGIPEPSVGDRKVAAMLGITNEEAHALLDVTTDCLDEAITENWGSE